jgi:hypothetical protein
LPMALSFRSYVFDLLRTSFISDYSASIYLA